LSRLLATSEIEHRLTTICCVISIDTDLHLYYSGDDRAGRFALGTGETRKNQRNRVKYFRISGTADNNQGRWGTQDMTSDSTIAADRSRWTTSSTDGGADGHTQRAVYPGARFIHGEFHALEPLDGPLLHEMLDVG